MARLPCPVPKSPYKWNRLGIGRPWRGGEKVETEGSREGFKGWYRSAGRATTGPGKPQGGGNVPLRASRVPCATVERLRRWVGHAGPLVASAGKRSAGFCLGGSVPGAPHFAGEPHSPWPFTINGSR